MGGLWRSLRRISCAAQKPYWKKDYDQIAANRSYFGDFDLFGNYELTFGAAKLNLKIVDLPIRYLERTYASTNFHAGSMVCYCYEWLFSLYAGSGSFGIFELYL